MYSLKFCNEYYLLFKNMPLTTIRKYTYMFIYVYLCIYAYVYI